MVDTMKIVTMINEKIYKHIYSRSKINTSYNNETGEVFYKIINNNVEGSYSSSLSVRVGNGAKYKFGNMYYIEIEGSYHKLIKGYNSHNGYYNVVQIASNLIKMVEQAYYIKLPKLNHWFVQRIDIAICFNLGNQNNVERYINNLSSCNYPKRKLKHYENESIYLTGSTTTLKIYNKLLEFKKNDIKKFRETDFNMEKYTKEIEGFVRFECEIKKRTLQNVFNCNYVRVCNIDYDTLKGVWEQEFRKLLKLAESDMNVISERERVKERLSNTYSKSRAQNLYNYYILILSLGIKEVRKSNKKSMYYKNIRELKNVGVDFSQKYDIQLNENRIEFNPFEAEEIL